MLLQLLLQQGNQCAVAKRVLIRNAQDDRRFIVHLFREFFAQAVGVAALHHKYDCGPAQVPGRDAHPRARLGTGRARFVMRMVVEKPLSGETAPLILAADKKDSQVVGTE